MRSAERLGRQVLDAAYRACRENYSRGNVGPQRKVLCTLGRSSDECSISLPSFLAFFGALRSLFLVLRRATRLALDGLKVPKLQTKKVSWLSSNSGFDGLVPAQFRKGKSRLCSASFSPSLPRRMKPQRSTAASKRPKHPPQLP